MFANIRKRLTKKHLDIKDCEADGKEDLLSFTPPTNYIKISQGKIHFVNQTSTAASETSDVCLQEKKNQEDLVNRVVELEEALLRLQEKLNNNQQVSPTFERELCDQIDSMKRVIKSKERKQLQTCRDYKVLQARFTRQENLLQLMQKERNALQMRIRQYEHCLDDVMRKVVDAIVAEDNLREEVASLKSRVRDLEAQNATLSISPAKGRDEGYCTMSSGQPPPSNNQLEDLPEEPEQWLLPAEPCSTEMEDWSMSQEELAVITLEDDCDKQSTLRRRLQNKDDSDWIWNSNDFFHSTLVETDSASDEISHLLQEKIDYSDDEELTCTEFTNDFYKLVNICSSSARSLYSYIEDETDDGNGDADGSSLSERNVCGHRSFTTPSMTTSSPTPSEAGRAQVTSCSSSETDEISRCTIQQEASPYTENVIEEIMDISTKNDEIKNDGELLELRRPSHGLVKSKSIVGAEEPSYILQSKQLPTLKSGMVRSGSVSDEMTEQANMKTCKPIPPVRLPQNRIASWRRSNGWKRVTTSVQPSNATISLKRCTKSEALKACQESSMRLQPTKIPTCSVVAQHQTIASKESLQPSTQSPQLQRSIRKSKIPPPVPVRRSYAS